MIAAWEWRIRKFRRGMWFPITIYAALGALTAIAAVALRSLVPPALVERFGGEAAGTILNILATSMLAVTTFSLSILTAALASAATGATPRATVLTKEDSVARRVLATFVGAFVFSLMGIIGLQAGLYEPTGRVVLFFVTLAVLAAIIFQLVRWIGHLTDFGRLLDTIARVEDATTRALTDRIAHPYLGGRPLPQTGPPPGLAVFANTTGYVQMVDVGGLDACAQKAGVTLSVAVLPGRFVHPAVPLLTVDGATAPLSDVQIKAFADCFAIGRARSYDQDPRFGLIVLTEIASRALSPAVNDPGTAIDILGRHVRVLSHWQDRAAATPRFPRVQVPRLDLDDLMADAFAPLARDGAAMIEVQIRVQKALLALVAQSPLFGAAALHQSRRALAFATDALRLEDDRATLERLQADVTAAVSGHAGARIPQTA